MKSLLTILAVFFLVTSLQAEGFILREENDAFTGSDDQYSQGLEFLTVGESIIGKHSIEMRSFGIRNLMYTPSNLSIATDQPDERPWAGLTAVLMEDWKFNKEESRRVEWMIGVLGEWSQSDHIQIWWHELGDWDTPMGWDNQIPNEPFFNVAVEYYKPLYSVGNNWKFDVTGLYGGSLGTAFVDGDLGALLRAGWRIPSDYSMGLINPTNFRKNDFSIYMFTETAGHLVIHNATLGGSLWQDGPERELEPLVYDLRAGIALGLDKAFGTQHSIRVSYSSVWRSKEFEQQDGGVDFGSILISSTRRF